MQPYAKARTFPRTLSQYRFREKSPEHSDRAFKLIAIEIDLSRANCVHHKRVLAHSRPLGIVYSVIYLAATGNHVTADAVNVLNTAWGVGYRYI